MDGTATRFDGAPVLQVEGVEFAFGEHPVLAGVDLAVAPGEVMGLVGANGVGKSTLAGVLAGTLRPAAGTVRIRGREVRPASPAEARADGVAIVEQRFSLAPGLRVAQALYRHTERSRAGMDELAPAARRLLVRTGIAIDPWDRLGELSRSELGMVESLRLLADPHDLTVVDEVAATFDAREVDELRYILSQLTRQGRGVLYVTHRLDEALLICERIAVMRDGRIVAVLDAAATTVDQLSEAMFGEVVAAPRRGLPADEPTPEAMLVADGVDAGGERPIRLTIRRGEVVGLLGGRGAGVEQVVGALTGERPQPAARIEMAGAPVTIDSRQAATGHRIAFLRAGDDDEADAAMAHSLLTGASGTTDYDEELAAMTAILAALRQADTAAKTLFGTRSGGQTQWERVRQIVADDSDLLILEDPTAALDLQAKQQLGHLLADVSAAGRSVLLLSGDASDLVTLTDRIVVLVDGRVESEWESGQTTVADIHAVMRQSQPEAQGPGSQGEPTSLSGPASLSESVPLSGLEPRGDLEAQGGLHDELRHQPAPLHQQPEPLAG